MEQKDFWVAFFYLYIIGAIPSGWIIVWSLTGENICKKGSGGIGANNVMRVLIDKVGGKKAKIWFLVTMIIDALKALCGVIIASFILKNSHLVPLAAIAIMIGNCYSVFLLFQGGKGVSTLLGIGLGLCPVITAPSLALWFWIYKKTKKTDRAGLAASFLMMLAILFLTTNIVLKYTIIILEVLIYLRHRDNIVNLWLEYRKRKEVR